MASSEQYQRALEQAQAAGDQEAVAYFTEKLSGMPQPGFQWGEMAGNIPSSAVNLAADVYQTLAHPIDTGKALYDTARGGLSMAMGWDDPAEAQARAVGDYYKQRYGGVEEFLQSAESDPLGVLTDVSGLLGGAGMATRAPALSRAAAMTDPLSLGANALTTGASRMMNAKNLYQSAAKFPVTTKRSPADIDRMTDTALREGILPNEAGVYKINETIADLNNQVSAAVAAAGGGAMPKDALFRYLKDVRRRAKEGINAPSDLKEIDRIVGQYNDFLEQSGKQTFTANDLQRLKTSAYRDIDFDRAAGKSTPVREDVYKAIARAAKEGIEDLTGSADVKALNARQGALLDLKHPLEQAASRIERRDLVGIGVPIKMATGEAMGGRTGGLLGMAQGIIDAPKPKSGAALMLHNAGQKSVLDLLGTQRFRQNLRAGLLEAGQIAQEDEYAY